MDDDTDVSRAFPTLLRLLGYQVQNRLPRRRGNRPSPRAALLDIGLPDMDGPELARRLREKYPDKDRLLLAAVTAYGHDEIRERSFAAGFDRHLAKHVDLSTLQALLADPIA